MPQQCGTSSARLLNKPAAIVESGQPLQVTRWGCLSGAPSSCSQLALREDGSLMDVCRMEQTMVAWCHSLDAALNTPCHRRKPRLWGPMMLMQASKTKWAICGESILVQEWLNAQCRLRQLAWLLDRAIDAWPHKVWQRPKHRCMQACSMMPKHIVHPQSICPSARGCPGCISSAPSCCHH